jgi:hypothetical protein
MKPKTVESQEELELECGVYPSGEVRTSWKNDSTVSRVITFAGQKKLVQGQARPALSTSNLIF